MATKINGNCTSSYNENNSNTENSIRKPIVYLIFVFLISVLLLIWGYTHFPEFDNDDYANLKLPKNIEEAKNLGKILSRYKEKFYFEVLGGVFMVYIFLQTFAVPGSIFLSILSGYLFPFQVALLLICFCSATGASLCYLLSYLVGRPLVKKYIPERVINWKLKIEKHKDNLLFYIIFLRITPFLPNWFINIASPVIDVPLTLFWFGTFIGVAPPSILAVQAGTTLYKLTSSTDTFSATSVVMLTLAALLSLVPVLIKNKLRAKFD